MGNKHTNLLLVAGVALVVWLVVLKKEPSQPPSEPLQEVAAQRETPPPDRPNPPAAEVSDSASPNVAPKNDEPPFLGTPNSANRPKSGPVRIRKGEPIPELFPHEKERDEIIRLSTLPPESGVLSTVAAYLKHDDATVREEARTALLRLSSPLAIPYLKEAAGSAKSAEEAKDLREAAEFLALVQDQANPPAETPAP